MNWKSEWKPLALIVAGFLVAFYLPVGSSRFDNALTESLALVRWYAREHVLLCLVPAFFIAGAIAAFVNQASVMKYFGAKANKVLSYGVASVSGTILAVCSCTVLPLFAGIYQMGAGLGPATAFLYSGPAINVLAIILTARILGFELGVARALGAVFFAVIIGLLMHFFFRKEEHAKVEAQMMLPEPQVTHPLWQNGLFFATMIGILVFANWGKPAETVGFWNAIYEMKWLLTGLFAIGLGAILSGWFGIPWTRTILVGVAVAASSVIFRREPLLPFAVGALGLAVIIAGREDEAGEWFNQTWSYAKQILPLLLIGVFVAGLLLGRPGKEGLIPSQWVGSAVGGNSIAANFFASIAGAFMYFATLTEVPILQGLIGSGMGKGPALALLLAGPALSLPSMLVIRTIIGTKKTSIYIFLVVVMATISGMIYGAF